MLDETDVITLVARIECEYREMPGLQLTEAQMQRMWRLDGATCQVVITVLVTQGIVLHAPSLRGYFPLGSNPRIS